MSQQTFASIAYNTKKKVTRRERFLEEMNAVVPWKRLQAVVSPLYPKKGAGRPPIGVERMLRIYCMQQWFQLSDPGMEDALYDMESMRRFAGIELGVDPVPDETTLCRFRHLLEEHELTAKIFSEIAEYLEERGLLVREGTIVDATIIAAPSSTKNKNKERDPEMSQVKKGNVWHFGMKAHIGVDTKSRVVHSVVCTTASVHDSQEMEELLHGDEKKIYGDKAYASKEKKEKYEAQGVHWNVARRGNRSRSLSKKDKEWNRRKSKVRAKGEHPFGVIKHLWGYAKTRYRGIAKNTSQLFSLFALANLYLLRKDLITIETAL
ncbi:MAG: IS5 family transposase [Bdellovibrionales bacterium]|nr:IS5 family transposase [Bdellovibrionales bacterium]